MSAAPPPLAPPAKNKRRRKRRKNKKKEEEEEEEEREVEEDTAEEEMDAIEAGRGHSGPSQKRGGAVDAEIVNPLHANAAAGSAGNASRSWRLAQLRLKSRVANASLNNLSPPAEIELVCGGERSSGDDGGDSGDRSNSGGGDCGDGGDSGGGGNSTGGDSSGNNNINNSAPLHPDRFTPKNASPRTIQAVVCCCRVWPLRLLAPTSQKLLCVGGIQAVWLAIAATWLSRVGHNLVDTPHGIADNYGVADLDCERIKSFRPVVCLYFLGFFFVSTLFHPHPKHAQSSVRHRGMFSKVTLLLVCVFIITAASIGFPQGLCLEGCTCGLCAGPFDVATNVSSCSLSKKKKRNCSLTEREVRNVTAASKQGQQCAGTGVMPAKVCPHTVEKGHIFKAELSPNSSTTLTGARMESLLNELIAFASSNKDLSDDPAILYSTLEVNSQCKKQWDNTMCVNLTPNAGLHPLQNLLTDVAVPVICDKLYDFCDKKNDLRSTCPDTQCCSMCNFAALVHECNFENTIRVELEIGSAELESNKKLLELIPGFDPGLIMDVSIALKWSTETFLSLLNTTDFNWNSCVSECEDPQKHLAQAPWYGKQEDCLHAKDRSWPLPNSSSTDTNTTNERSASKGDAGCKCDEHVRAWSRSVVTLHGVFFAGAFVLIGLQGWIAVMWDKEALAIIEVAGKMSPTFIAGKSIAQRCFRAKEQLLAAAVTVILLVCLTRQIDDVISATSGVNCFSAECASVADPLKAADALHNDNLMKSWIALSVVMAIIVVLVLLLPALNWILRSAYAKAEAEAEAEAEAGRRAASTSGRNASATSVDTTPVASSCSRYAVKLTGRYVARMLRCIKSSVDAKHAYDELFSFERGRWYLYMRLASEIVEVANQTSQLISFSHERPYEWIYAVSIALILNGICTPAPFLLAHWFPRCKHEIKLVLAVLDATFDGVFLLIAIVFTEKESFGQDRWLVAIAGVVLPVVGIALVADDISEAARNEVLSKEWKERVGTVRPRRRSSMILANVDTVSPPPPPASKAAKRRIAHHIPRAGVPLSLLISMFCVVCGGVFLNMAGEGDRECRGILGDALWEGSAPKFVILKSDEVHSLPVLRGGCNLTVIESILTVDVGRQDGGATFPPMVQLPSALSRLERLKSIVLLGQHRIASDGVPASILDGVSLARLTRLEFGKESPVNRVLNLSQSGDYLDTFPPHVMQYMTALESLQLSRTNISCFPPRLEFSRLKHLRELNLSGTRIHYLPPSVLFDNPQLNVHFSDDTPVSRALDWSDHGLDGMGFDGRDWHRLATTLPLLTSLNISGNALKNASALDLHALRHLRSLDVSRNPELTPKTTESFSWWKVFSEHETLGSDASFIGLANVGLSGNNVRIFSDAGGAVGTMTCDQLKWVHRTMTPDRRTVDLSRNHKLEFFGSWTYDGKTEFKLPCHKDCPIDPDGFYIDPECLFVDEALYFLLLEILPSVENLGIRNGGVFQPNIAKLTHGTISLRTLAEQCSVRAPSLEAVVLRGHDFRESIPSEFGALKDLSILILPQNQLTGMLEKSFVQSLTQLRSFEVSENQLQGKIPEEIRQLHALDQLVLRNNNFSGPLDFMTNLTNLRVARLSDNSFSSSLPAGISRLTRLERLSAHNLDITGSIPEGVGQLVLLSNLDLRTNGITGSIPTSIGALTSMRKLYLGFNSLSGVIPDSITKLTLLDILQFAGNNLSGPLPIGLGALRNLQSLNISKSRNTVGSGKLNETIPASMYDLKHLSRLDLSGHDLQGQIGNVKKLTALLHLDLHSNQLNGSIPAALGDLTRLTHLDLHTNRLNGSIPAALGDLTRLTRLDLHDNRLVGAVPQSLSALKKLEYFDLSGNGGLDTDTFPPKIGDLCLQTVEYSYENCPS